MSDQVETNSTYSFETFLQPVVEVSHPDFFAEVSSPEIIDLNDSVQDTDDDVHLSASSGFMLTEDDHFATFDADHGACDWGVDMSLNSDF